MQNFKNWLLNETKNQLPSLEYGKPKQDAHLLNKPVSYFDSKWKEINLKDPPENSSNMTKKELDEILSYRLKNSALDSKKIREQDVPDVELLFVKLLKELGENLDQQLIKNISKVSEELSTISLRHKVKFDRPRPFQILQAMGLKGGPKGRTTGSPSYPSTHAVIGTFMARWLSGLYPRHKKELNKLGKELGDYRVKAGFHYPSDRDAGNYLAKELFKVFKEDTK